MFHIYHEFFLYIDAPIQKAWDVITNVNNWSKWSDVESCEIQGDFETGNIIKVFSKNKSAKLFITEVRPYQEYKTLSGKMGTFVESSIIFEKIDENKTMYFSKAYLSSPLMPLIKSRIMKSLKDAQSKLKTSFSEIFKEKGYENLRMPPPVSLKKQEVSSKL